MCLYVKETNQIFDLNSHDCLIGRSQDCHLQIELNHVSRKHALIRFKENGKITIVNFGINGTLKITRKDIVTKLSFDFSENFEQNQNNNEKTPILLLNKNSKIPNIEITNKKELEMIEEKFQQLFHSKKKIKKNKNKQNFLKKQIPNQETTQINIQFQELLALSKKSGTKNNQFKFSNQENISQNFQNKFSNEKQKSPKLIQAFQTAMNSITFENNNNENKNNKNKNKKKIENSQILTQSLLKNQRNKLKKTKQTKFISPMTQIQNEIKGKNPIREKIQNYGFNSPLTLKKQKEIAKENQQEKSKFAQEIANRVVPVPFVVYENFDEDYFEEDYFD
ncbi:traf-interacting protein with fha domain-containing protein b [Anaeramoeba ignava]|uniref:Traf-interacting protein with fha domain-containing protein b n=1 Tax=Anaeramoeba ignava TaxID=1746090 RepID=A0A9Q0L9I9_ANAIG|nr:traf-interacting protein with fha domain-containing protein b [Anaeramoeba ignava]